MTVRVKKFRFLEDGLAGDVYYERGRQDFHGLGIFLYGFPAFPGVNSAIDTMVSNGLVAISPHYFGSYDSSGLLSAQSLIDTVAQTNRLVARGYLTQAKDGKHFALPSKWVLCVAHSFGCASAIRAVRDLPGLQTMLLLAPTAHYGTGERDFGIREDGFEQLEYVRTSHPYTYRLSTNDEWAEIFDGEDVGSADPRNHSPRVVAVVGQEDSYFDLSVTQQRLPSLLTEYTGDSSPKLILVPGAGHPVAELLGTGAFDLDQLLQNSSAR